jgi:hypothetical protein
MIRIRQILQLNNKQKEYFRTNFLGGMICYYSIITPLMFLLLNNRNDPNNFNNRNKQDKI